MEGGNLRTPEVHRFPMAVQIGSRDGTLSKDGYLQNLQIEQKQDGRVFVQRRAGTSSFTTFDGGGNATTQGMWEYKGYILAAAANRLTRIVSPTSSGFTVGTAWSSLTTPTWQGRTAAACVYFNNKVFVIGGLSTPVTSLADVWASSDGGTTWVQLVSAAPWGTRSLHKAIVFNDRLYVMGGVDSAGTFYNDVWVTDDGVNWNLVTASAGWSPRSAFAACVYNNGIWVLGGSTGGQEVWFSTDGATWIQMANAAWTGRANHEAINFHGNMLVIGGTTGGREVWSTPDGITWTQLTNVAFSTARSSFACCIYNDKIWVICGVDGVGPLTQVWTSVDGTAWVQVTAAFGGTGRYQCRAVVGPHPTSATKAPTIYLIGGLDLVPNFYREFWTANINGTLGTTWTIPSPITAEKLEATAVNANEFFALKDTAGMYVFHADSIVRVTDTNYPQVTVPGVVNLDETVYVMDPTGLIVGSAIGDPRIWPSRNFLGADYESDGGVVLLKYQNFAVAIGNYTTQFLINAGAPGGTLLKPVKNMNIRVGGAFPYAAIEIEETIIWLGRTKDSKKLQANRMVGTGLKVISTPAVDRIFSTWVVTDEVFAFPFKGRGHSFYLVTNFNKNITLAYDMGNGEWTIFAGNVTGTDTFLQYLATATDGTNDYALSYGSKSISTIDDGVFLDRGSAARIRIVTNLLDGGSMLRKSCNDFALIMDRVANSTVTLEFTKDDYQTYSAAATLNVDVTRCHQPRIGQYRRIAFRVTHFTGTDFRGELFEMQNRLGN